MQQNKQEFTPNSASQEKERNILWMATMTIGLLLNHVGGLITLYIKLPIYLDNIGAILATILVGTRIGIITSILSALLGGILINPVMPYYTLTTVAIALFAGWMAKKGYFRSVPRAVAAGILMGIVSGTCNAPIILLLGGFSGTCTDVSTVLLLASGQSIFTSAFLSNFVNDPFDKVIQCLLVVWIIRGFPKTLQAHFANSGYLMRNVKK